VHISAFGLLCVHLIFARRSSSPSDCWRSIASVRSSDSRRRLLRDPAVYQRRSGQLVYALINLFSGGALLQLSVFALGIMPYITASIILQLLTVVIPRLETLKADGQAGQAKITQYTRYVTIGLAILQSTAILSLAARRARCSAAATSS